MLLKLRNTNFDGKTNTTNFNAFPKALWLDGDHSMISQAQPATSVQNLQALVQEVTNQAPCLAEHRGLWSANWSNENLANRRCNLTHFLAHTIARRLSKLPPHFDNNQADNSSPVSIQTLISGESTSTLTYRTLLASLRTRKGAKKGIISGPKVAESDPQRSTINQHT